MIPEKAVRIVRRGVLFASAAFLSWIVLNLKWPTILFFPSDVSFLLVPFLSFLIVLFAASVASISIGNELWKGTATKALRGLAFSVFILQIYSRTAFPNSVQITYLPIQLTIGALVATAIAVEFPRLHKYREPLLTAVSASTFAFSSYCIALALSKEDNFIVNAALPFVGGLLAVGLGVLGGFLKYAKNVRMQSMAEWISGDAVRNFLVGFLLVLYFFHLRPSVVGAMPSWIGIEWVLISSAVAAVYLNIARLSDNLYDDSASKREWRKHMQKVKFETGKDFADLLHAQKAFVNENVKEPLLVYLAYYLHYLGQPGSVLTALTPLINYREAKSSLMFLPWVRRRLKRKNLKVRTRILESILERLERAGNL